MEDNDNNPGDNNKYINIDKHTTDMDKIKGIFKFKYTELINNNERQSELVIETKDVVRSIGKFGATRQLTDLDVKQLNNK